MAFLQKRGLQRNRMKRQLSIGIDDFKEIITQNYYYIMIDLIRFFKTKRLNTGFSKWQICLKCA
jgi:hypothetical protein